jgi:hypothetical protein
MFRVVGFCGKETGAESAKGRHGSTGLRGDCDGITGDGFCFASAGAESQELSPKEVRCIGENLRSFHNNSNRAPQVLAF